MGCGAKEGGREGGRKKGIFLTGIQCKDAIKINYVLSMLQSKKYLGNAEKRKPT
jgi:hypothetical protein